MRNNEQQLCERAISMFQQGNVSVQVFNVRKTIEEWQPGHRGRYDSMSDLGEIEVYLRADFQSGSRVLKKVF